MKIKRVFFYTLFELKLSKKNNNNNNKKRRLNVFIGHIKKNHITWFAIIIDRMLRCIPVVSKRVNAKWIKYNMLFITKHKICILYYIRIRYKVIVFYHEVTYFFYDTIHGFSTTK